jgi:hypothetical protein
MFQPPHPHPPPVAPHLPVLTFIKWNVQNVRGYERAGRFFNKVDFLLMIKWAQFIGKSCFTTGASKGPTGVNAPVVI